MLNLLEVPKAFNAAGWYCMYLGHSGRSDVNYSCTCESFEVIYALVA